MSASRTARDRVRAELTREIKEAARSRLADDGAAGLSLRAVARDLGMASSALYRYFPSRDDLLTALIVDAYAALGSTAEAANDACAREDLRGRWFSTCRALRLWALAHPHEYALVYGTPVPGYRAPRDTVEPAGRAMRVLTGILADAWAAGRLGPGVAGPPIPDPVRADAARVGEALMPGVPEDAVMRGVVALTQLFGAISLELFGQLEGAVDARDAFFDHNTALMADFVGLAATSTLDRHGQRGARARSA
jgi:AcrR family transcriptional regulator